MTTTTQRKRSAKLVPAEAPRSAGSLVLLPAGAPDIVSVQNDEPTGVAAKTLTVKAKAKATVKIGSGAAKGKATVSASAQVSVGTHAQHKSGSSPRTNDPDVAYAFRLLMNGMTYGMFTEISGLSWKAEPIPVVQGGQNDFVTTMVGRGKFEPLVLKRGWFASTGEFYDMLRKTLSAEGTIRNAISISVLNRKYEEIGVYTFDRAYIIEYTGPSLNSMSAQVGFEQIRLSYDKFTYQPK